MEVKEDKLIFSTGKEVYCFCEIVGISLSLGEHLNKLTDGYDGKIVTVLDIEDYDKKEFSEDYPNALTIEECIELADHMIKEWQEFKALADQAQ
jgi:hypothetical protein